MKKRRLPYQHLLDRAQETGSRACDVLDANPGITWTGLATAMGVTRKTAGYYIKLHRAGWKPGDPMPRVKR
ncbi:MAG: hypothetical protein U5K75_12010 [Ahrensia sp.]|nr:hypothetical protein [Ahrensia sp.]